MDAVAAQVNEKLDSDESTSGADEMRDDDHDDAERHQHEAKEERPLQGDDDVMHRRERHGCGRIA